MKKILRWFRDYFFWVLYFLFRIFPIKKNKIFIQNFNGKGYGDNPKYIVEEILRQSLSYDLVWAVKKPSTNDWPPIMASYFPSKVRIVPYKTIRAIYEEVTAKIWIDNCRKQYYVQKRPEQFYIQTWHGMIGPKKMEKDVENELDPYYVRQAKHDSKLIDIFLSNGEYASNLIKSSFWYRGEILESGYPRSDIHIDQSNEIKHKIHKFFKLDKDIKIILYAPTFRNNFDKKTYNIDYKNILNAMQKNTNKDWIFLIRLHPNISEKAELFTYNKNILNASYYNDIQELMLASDILITDYSDCMCDFSLMKKPVFLYINDYNEYRIERSFYYDFFTLPFPTAFSTEELLKKILDFNQINYIQVLEEFHHQLMVMDDGNASKRVVDRIFIESKNAFI
jgi:CDP-glycerol glycerophosphotransferase